MNLNFSIDWTELSIQWMLTCGHFLWQAIAVAIVFLGIERLAGTRASFRYALACTALLSLPLCILLTFASIHSERKSSLSNSPRLTNTASSQPTKVTNAPWTELDLPSDKPSDGSFTPQDSTIASFRVSENEAATSKPVPFTQRARFLAPIISAGYAIVVVLLFIRIGLSLLGSFGFGNLAQRVTDSQILQDVSDQAKRMKLKTVPIVAFCLQVSSPVVVGIVRPMILLPPSLLCGLDQTQLAAILSHEMAHIRRYDLLFNLAQRVIESILFFHPIVWWLSRRVTIERENCCDDVAVMHVGRLNYAGALVQMATLCLANHRSRSQALATLAADGGNSTDFGYRIRRLIDAQETPRIRVTKRSFTLCMATMALMGASFVSLAQNPPTQKIQSQVNEPYKDALANSIQWSTCDDRDGLLSGARLILPEGGVHTGQPAIVEYRLKNVSTETKKLTCFVRSSWQFLTLASQNRIRDMGIDPSDQSIEIALEPGEEYVATSHTATIDTQGLPPGNYQVALGSAFWIPDADNPGAKVEIPQRGSLLLTIPGTTDEATNRALDRSVHWGEAISGLRLGVKFRIPTKSFTVGDVVEADLWIANVNDHAIKCSIRLPHPMDGWLFNVENHLGDTILLEQPPMISSPLPQQFYELKLAPGEVKALTGDRAEGQSDAIAGRPAKFAIVSNKEGQGWGDDTIKGRLIADSGNFSAIFKVILERPDVPGLRIELDTGNCSFTVGKPLFDARATRVLDESTDKSILWGEPVGGMRLGIRQSEFARRRQMLRHGEHIEYEVWIKNETDEVVRIARDPRDWYNPRLMDDQSINVIGNRGWMSFSIPHEELAKAELVLPPGHAALRFPSPQHSASIRPPGSPRGRFGSDPLLLEPGKYNVYAQIDDLKSGVEEVEIISAARLQVRKSSRVTNEKRESAATNPSDAILEWQSGDGAKQETMINWDHGIIIDERDLASAEIVAAEGKSDQYSIALKLQPESSSWLSSRIAMYSLWDDPDMVAILLDEKALGAVNIPSPIPDDTLVIAVGPSLKQAEATIREIQAAMAVAALPNAVPPTDSEAFKH